MSVSPTSHFITLTDCPVVQENGDVVVECLKLHYWEWKGHRSATILFCHAASFHGRCYDRIIEGALNGYRVIALDLRGHGRSQKHPPPYRFCWFGNDVLKFIEQMNLCEDHLIGIGHSVGGYALTWAAAKASKRLFQSLLLLDPVIFHPTIYEPDEAELFFGNGVNRRRSQWKSVNDMIAKLEIRSPFSRWPKDVLRDYCTYAVDKNFSLQCTPEREASIYKYSHHSESNVYPLLKQSRWIHYIPVQIVRVSVPFTEDGLTGSPTNPELVKWFKNGRETELKDANHLFPMEQPQLAISMITDFLNEQRKLYSSL